MRLRRRRRRAQGWPRGLFDAPVEHEIAVIFKELVEAGLGKAGELDLSFLGSTNLSRGGNRAGPKNPPKPRRAETVDPLTMIAVVTLPQEVRGPSAAYRGDGNQTCDARARR